MLFQESALEKSCKPLPALSSLNGFCRINLLFLLNGGYSEWEEVSSQGTGLSTESPWERQLDLHWVTSSRGPLNILFKGSECRLYPVHQSAGQREQRQTALQVTGYHTALAPVHALLVPEGSASTRGEMLSQEHSGEQRACPWPCFPGRHFQSKEGESSWQRSRLIQGMQIIGPGLHMEGEKQRSSNSP